MSKDHMRNFDFHDQCSDRYDFQIKFGVLKDAGAAVVYQQCKTP